MLLVEVSARMHDNGEWNENGGCMENYETT